jgi:ornithine carbamoyltransferase
VRTLWYTDVWGNYGARKAEKEARRRSIPRYNQRGMHELAKPDAIVLHCLPPIARRDFCDIMAKTQNGHLGPSGEADSNNAKSIASR